MPNWNQKGFGIYEVQPTEPQMTQEERNAYLDNLLAELRTKLDAAKQYRKGMTA